MHSSLKRRAVGPPEDQPPSIRQNLDVSQSFEYVKDIFSDDTHRQMDQQVLELMPHLSPKTQAGAVFLLLVIVQFSAGRLQSKYNDIREGRALVAEHPGLIDLLQEAWSCQSFKKIRNLKILNVSSKFKLSTGEQTYNSVQSLAISTAWKGQYRGEYHKNLYSTLNRMQHSMPYSNIVSIIQSSGSGKSRMVDNMARLVFTIPFNIRPPKDPQVLAFPPPDTQIFVLLTQPGVQSIDALHAYYLLFLRHVFEEIRKAFTESRGRIISGKDIVLKDYETETRSAFDKLSTAIDRCIKRRQSFDEKIKVVMYFDECHPLSTVPAPSNKDDKTLLDVLFTAIDSLSSRPLMAIFLSTTFHISTLAPIAPYARSAQALQYWNKIQPPITETPFDCGPMLPLASNTLRLRDTCTVEFMAQFGRPLFWTMIQNAGNRKDDILSTIIDLARSKLLCYNDINVAHRDPTTKLPKHAPTAVLDLRLMFDYELGREVIRAFEAQLVASHMRTLFSVPQIGEYFRSGYPSEPLLAEAAAQQMGVFRSKAADFTMDILMENLKSGRLDMEKCGELVARELLTSSYDRAIEREFQVSTTDSSSGRLLYSKGVSVITFIEELFVSRYAEQILDSIPNNVENPMLFREAFQNAKVRFTHFGKMIDESGTTSDAVWVALIRGMAIIAAMGTYNINLIIPVLLRADATICEEEVTGMLISVKSRKAKGTVVNYEVDEKAIKFFPENIKASRRPYISLVMELGTNVNTSKPNKNKGKKHGTFQSNQHQRQQMPSKIKSSERRHHHHSSSAHPRYSIFAYGCSNTVYKGITSAQSEKYQFLVSSDSLVDFLVEHPRQDDAMLSELRQMKPFWKAGAGFYDWITDIPRLSHEVQSTPEGVITG